MLTIIVPKQEVYNPRKNEFIETSKDYVLKLEHSLISISKWETIYKKPYLNGKEKTPAEFIDYVKCMTVNSDVPDEVYGLLTNKDMNRIIEYIRDTATATVIVDYRKNRRKNAVDEPTSELIYYWMISNNIPVEVCEKWRLNRLLKLIEICNIKGNPTPMSKQEIYTMQSKLNAERCKKYGTPG